MPPSELLGAAVELGPAGPPPGDLLLDVALPGGLAHLVADRRHAILRVAGMAAFAIEGGERIRVELDPGVEADAVSSWLHGTVAALLLAQQGRFALHASVVDVAGRAIALAGRRRAGKSTTALRLTQRGHRLVADDVCPLETGVSVAVHPFARSVHVAHDTAQSLNLDVSQGRPILPRRLKVALPPPPPSAPVQLAGVVVLDRGADGAVATAPVRGARAQWLVGLNTYRADLLSELWESEMFAWAGAVAATVPVHVVARPDDGWTVDAVADAVELIASES